MGITATCTAYGRRRLKALKQIKSREDWEKLWPAPGHAYPFTWGDCWKAVTEFGVSNFPAELGFYLDILGMKVNAMWDGHAMIMTPDADFAFTIHAAKRTATELNLQFMLGNIAVAAAALKRRGLRFAQELKAEWGDEHPMRTCKLRTPSGMIITLWGMVEVGKKSAKKVAKAKSAPEKAKKVGRKRG
jgi:hypothetical protein